MKVVVTEVPIEPMRLYRRFKVRRRRKSFQLSGIVDGDVDGDGGGVVVAVDDFLVG